MPAFERVKESYAKALSLTSCGSEMDPRFRGSDEFLKQNQIIPSFPRKRESMRSQSATFVHFDFFTHSFAGKAMVETELPGRDRPLTTPEPACPWRGRFR